MKSRANLMTSPKASLLLLVILCHTALAKTTIYEFVPGQSTVIYQNWSWGYVKKTRSAAGHCRLTVDSDAGLAWFDQVDAELSEEIWCLDCYDNEPDLRTTSLGVLFHMSELKSTDVNDTVIRFVYERNIPTFPHADVHLTLTFTENSVHLTGRFSEACYDCGQFDLDAVALKKTTVYYVDGDGPADLNNIQAAIDDANDGDVIIIKPGTYTGLGNRDIDFKGKAITVRSEQGPSTCIIDCQGQFYYDWEAHHLYEDYHRGFHFHSGEDANSVVQGFTITNGCAAEEGGGIYCYHSSPRIVDCIVANNTARNRGGGIAASFSDVRVAGCIIVNNIASRSPWAWHDSLEVSSGGGTAISGSHPTLINCLITGNRASSYGGGILCEGNPVLINCTICENRTGKYSCGGGVEYAGIDGDKAILRNCILWGNAAAVCGEQISISSAAGILGEPQMELVHCIVQNGPNAVYSVRPIEGDWTSTEPHFASPGCWHPNGTPEDASDDFWIDGDYHLKSQAGRWDPNSQTWVQDDVTSPCIDAGNPMSPIGLELFPNGGIINTGAYGGTNEASKSYFGKAPCGTIIAGDVNGDCKVDFADFQLMALHWLEKSQ